MKIEKIKNWNDLPITLTVYDVQRVTGLSDRTVYTLLRKGEMPGRQVGQTWLIEKSALKDYLQKSA